MAGVTPSYITLAGTDIYDTTASTPVRRYVTVNDTSPSDGFIPIGIGGTNKYLCSGLSSGPGVNITNGPGSISFSSQVASAVMTGNTTAVPALVTYTPTVAGTFRVGAFATINSVSVDTLQIQVTYIDETSTSRTQTFFPQGLTSATLGTVGAFVFPTMDIRVGANQAITVAAVLTLGTGTINYDVGAAIELVSN